MTINGFWSAAQAVGQGGYFRSGLDCCVLQAMYAWACVSWHASQRIQIRCASWRWVHATPLALSLSPTLSLGLWLCLIPNKWSVWQTMSLWLVANVWGAALQINKTFASALLIWPTATGFYLTSAAFPRGHSPLPRSHSQKLIRVSAT